MAKKKRSKTRKKTRFLKTREGTLTNFTKVSPGKFAFVFKKNNKLVIGKSRFKTKASLLKKFKTMSR